MKRNWQTRAVFASTLALSMAVASAAPPVKGAASAAASDSLATLGDSRLMGELADRGLDSLLDRYFDLHKTSDAEQRAIRSTEALHDLSDPKVPNAEKEKKVRQIVEGLHILLPTMKDPFRLATDGGLLMLYGVTRDANLLEYWGTNSATEARLRPVAQAVYDILGRAAKTATADAGAMATKITVQNQNTVGAQWQKLDDLSHTAQYSQNMMAYYLALAMPMAQRAPIVDAALTYLADLDTPDSNVMARVQVTMGKLKLVEGKYDDAIKLLGAVAASDKSIQPPPEPAEVYEAKYFENVAHLQAGQIDAAKKGLEDLITWQKTAMPNDPATQKGVAAAAEMLRYRIFLAEAAQAKDPAARKTAEDSAVNVLLTLSKNRPDLRGIIYQQLVDRLSKNAPVKTMDPLLLQGLMAKGYSEASKPEGSKMDQEILQRGLAAADEMATRPLSGTVTAEMKDEAGRLAPVLLEAMGKKLEAAEGYLKYAENSAASHLQYAQGALEDAGRLAFELRRTRREDPDVVTLYDHFLPVAIKAPFNKVGLAFYYGQRLEAESKPQEAIPYFRMVAKADHNYNSAQYYMMQANEELLDAPKLTEMQRTLLAQDLMRQTEAVRQTYGPLKDPASRERTAIATLVAAETAGGDLKKPAETLKLLDGFEASVSGTPDEKLLVGRALLARVNAHMALGQLKQATDTLVALLNHTGGAQGAQFVRGLLDRLDKNLDKAQADHDTTAMRDIARSESDLSGFLVEWARTNPAPEIKKYTYQYMVFDARTKRLAGSLATDPADRKRLLDLAMAAYKNLERPDNAKLFRATLDPAKIASGDIDPTQPDPNVMLGIGLTDFDLKDYKAAATILGNLLNSGKLGGATLLVPDADGGQKVIENDTYWETTYKLYASNVADAKSPSDSALDGTKQGLKNILVRGGIPAKWQDDFDDLRKKIIPDFNVAALLAATSQPAEAEAATPAKH